MTVAALLFSVLLASDGGTPSAARVASADEAFLRMDYPASIARYEALLTSSPDDPQILWRIARAYVCMGETLVDGRRKEYALKAEQYARRCIRKDSLLAEGHTWVAGALGYVALDETLKRQAELSFEILAEADRALALNPNDDAALSIKGSLYRAIGNIGWVKRRIGDLLLGGVPEGGFEESEAALLQAVSLAPEVMRHHYELGILSIDMKKFDRARRELEVVLRLPVRVAIDIPRQEKARDLLRSLGPP